MDIIKGIIIGIVGYYVYDKYTHSCSCDATKELPTRTTAPTQQLPTAIAGPASRNVTVVY